MNLCKDVQFVFRGNLTRMWIHLCGEYDKEISQCLSFPFIKKLGKQYKYITLDPIGYDDL